MAIEIVFLSVVLRKSRLVQLESRARALVQALFRWEPEWFREDEHLIGTSFMCPADVRAFCGALERRTALQRNVDWAVVDMATGILEPVHWLEFDGGHGKVSGVWLQGTGPSVLSQVPSLVPGQVRRATESWAYVKLFGRDSNHDAEEHWADFGRIIPAWGGRDLWLVEAGPERDAGGRDGPRRWLSIPTRELDSSARAGPQGNPGRKAGRGTRKGGWFHSGQGGADAWGQGWRGWLARERPSAGSRGGGGPGAKASRRSRRSFPTLFRGGPPGRRGASARRPGQLP
jgi:hypothetical protein